MFRYSVRGQQFDSDKDLQILIARVRSGFGRIPAIRRYLHLHQIHRHGGELVAWFSIHNNRIQTILR